MSLKDLFKQQSKKFLKPSTPKTVANEIESVDYVEAHNTDKDTFIPIVDFNKPENFARYGSAKKYYTDAFTRITDQYPYDGSAKEKMLWYVSSSYIDKHIYDNEYPRTNGYINLCPKGYGSFSVGSTTSWIEPGGATKTYRAPSVKEYILIKGGPNADSDLNIKTPSSLANKYDPGNNQLSNLRINPASGSTVEFWLKIDDYPSIGSDGGTDRMTIFDVWNGITASNASYGRFEIYIDNDGTGSNAAFGLHVISGATGQDAGVDDNFLGFNALSASVNNEGLFTSYTKDTLADSSWHHYAFVVKNSGSDLMAEMFVDGQIQQTLTKTGEALGEISGGPLVATLGASNSWPEFIKDPGTFDTPSSYSVARGANKLSGSIDEFRYWKDARTAKEIGRHWFTQVNGGTNTQITNVDLGVYYKFNEGITNTASVDSVILDYSGRISNGAWVIDSGMTGSLYRATDSAIVISEAAKKEFKDPIVYDFHPDVKNKKQELENSGSLHDDVNTSMLYNSMPMWITDGDTEEELKNFLQILSSYFDTLHLQIEALPRLRDLSYQTGSHKPYFFNKNILDNTGFNTAELFFDEDFIENFDDRDDEIVFRDKLHNIKNTIYNNIYNNLVYINKSKGTEKSFRNLIRCFGIDEELIKLNVYGSNSTHNLEDNYRDTSKTISVVNFNSGSEVTGNRAASVYQYTDPSNANSISYINGSADDGGEEAFNPITTEAEIYFPLKFSEASAQYNPFTDVSSSLFGCFTAKADPSDYTTASPDTAGFQVYSVRKHDNLNTKDRYFYLTGTYIPALETEVFEDVYDNEKWNFAVRFRYDKEPLVNEVTGAWISGSINNNDILVEFHGINTEAGIVKRQFSVSGTLDKDLAASYGSFFSEKRRFYVGAHRTDADGSLITSTDVNVSYLRHWLSNVTDEEIKAHALTSENYGVQAPFENLSIFDTNINTGSIEIPKIETLALNWSFNNITSSDASGEFIVIDESSGSADQLNRYGWLSQITKKQHTGRGFNFIENKSDVTKNLYIPTTRQTTPENLLSSQTIKILDADDEVFTRESRPVNYFFALEKSPYQNISEEMMNFFATIKNFNNLIGEPINRYRQDYKEMGKLRGLFFEKLGNTPSVEKYLNFYKWLDSSISDMLMNLVPASANFAENVRTVIESHVLERNKYWSKLPTIEYKPKADPEGSMKGVKELKYNWKFGHPPLVLGRPGEEKTNCLWWKDRAPRDVQAFDGEVSDRNFLSSSNEFVNLNKKDILQVIVTETSSSNPKLATVDGVTYQGSSYALRSLSKAHELNINPVSVNAAPLKTKKQDIWKGEIRDMSSDAISIASSSLTKDPSSGCADELIPRELQKHKYNFTITTTQGEEYLQGYGELLAPFSIYSSSVGSGYNAALSGFSNDVHLTNLHVDSYTGEEPMQGPFTEKYVGGRQYRHVNLNNSNGKDLDIRNRGTNPRPEGYYLRASGNSILIRSQAGTSVLAKKHPHARYYRDEVAKRPVNIRNIRQGTGSIEGGVTVIGNFEHNYQVVHTTGRSVNDLWFRSGSNGTGGIDDNFKASEYVSGTVDNRLPDRSTLSDGSKNKTVIAERFSAPGSPETLSRGFLDESESFSVYNNMNYRNSLVRNFLNDYHSRRTEQFGLLKDTSLATDVEGDDNTYEDISPSYHKVNRNPQYRMELAEGYELADDQDNGFDSSVVYTTASVFDNQFVQRVIPQSERQYAWITASLDNRVDPSISAPHTFVITQDGMLSSSADAIQGWYNPFTWVTQSDFGSYYRSPGVRNWGTFNAKIDNTTWKQFIPVDFVGLNTNIVEPIELNRQNLLGYDLTDESFDGAQPYINTTIIYGDSFSATPNSWGTGSYPDFPGVETTLNSILLHRNGPGGYPMWKQVRTGNHPVARYMRKKNNISILSLEGAKQISDTNGTKERSTVAYTEPAVAFQNKPIIHEFALQSGKSMIVANSYQNIKETFSRPSLRLNADTIYETQLTPYNSFLGLYKNGTTGQVEKLDRLTYTQTIFPRNQFVGLAKIRTRQNYAETVGSATEGTGLDHKNRNTFWTSIRENRGLTINQAENSLGNIDNGQGRNDLTGTRLNVWAMGPIEAGPLTTVVDPITAEVNNYERSSFFGELYPSGTYESLYTTASMSFMRSVASRATGSAFSDNDFPELGSQVTAGAIPRLSSPSTGSISFGVTFSSLVGKGGVPVRMGKYDAHLKRKKLLRNNTYITEPRNPWFNSYDEYSSDIKLIGQDYSIIPEFKISDHIDYYVDNFGSFGGNIKNNKFLSLKGAHITASATDELNPLTSLFFTTYSNSDFLRYFDVVKDDHDSGQYRASKVTLKCSGVKKLLPYNGFYPMHRTQQLGALLSQSLGDNLEYLGGSSHSGSWNTTGSNTSWYPATDFNVQRLNALLQPIAAPGVLYNSIKAGIAVDYPIHTGNVEIDVTPDSGIPVDGTLGTIGHALEVINTRPNYRMPFEALVNFKAYVPRMNFPDFPDASVNDKAKLNFIEPNFIHSTNEFGDDNASGLGSTLSRADIGPKINAQWTGEIKPQFEMAMNNFLGETVRFFLKDQNVKSFTSAQEKDIKFMVPGKTYYMDVVLRKTDNFVLSEGVLDDIGKLDSANTGSGPSAYWNSIRAGTFERDLVDQRGYIYGPGYRHYSFNLNIANDLSGNYTTADSYAYGTAYAPHSPPYLYGESIARISYEVDQDEYGTNEVVKIPLRTIIDGAQIEYFNTHIGLNKNDRDGRSDDVAPAFGDQMSVSSSLVLDATVRDPLTAFDPAGNPQSIAQQAGSSDNDRWVIYPRWECPTLNVSSSNSGTVRSIWHNYGRIPRSDEGIFMDIRESFPEITNNPRELFNTGSLIDILGFAKNANASAQRIGELADEKEISEAIVAIPYFEEKVNDADHGVYTVKPQALNSSNYNFIKINKKVFKLTEKNLRETNGEIAIKAGQDPFNFSGYDILPNDVIESLVPKQDIEETSISDMIQKMKKYVMPPQFNFLDSNKTPFVMYIFEFTHTLDKQDLCDIWNNLMPEISVKAEKQDSTISHNIGPYEFFGSKPPSTIPGNTLNGSGLLTGMSPFTTDANYPELRWMIFKVKRKAEQSYYNVTLTAEDDSDFKFDFKGTSGIKAPEYSYNWPYDFFSLVELAKIDTSIQISNRDNDA
jgi:hypothetical protein